MATSIKICGLRDAQAAQAAAAAGADALGFVFYTPSPRCVTVEAAAQIIHSLPPFVTSVGLFVNPTVEDVNAAITECGLDLLQFHGDEDEAFCRQFSRPYIKAIRVKSSACITQAQTHYASARGLLLDAFVQGIPGGTGVAFDWSLIPHDVSKPLIVAGGLTPENVATLIDDVKPFAVDVSGGVEAIKGVKDLDKIRAFIRAVNAASLAR